MVSCTDENHCFRIAALNFVNQQPVGFKMALPAISPFTAQRMVTIFRFKQFAAHEVVSNNFELFYVFPTLDGKPKVPVKA